MADTVQNFRSAFHGFNRDDVVHYLETMSNQHTIALNQLQDDLKHAEEERDQFWEALSAKTAEAAELEAKLAELNEALDAATDPTPSVDAELYASLQAENAVLTQTVAALEAQIAEMKGTEGAPAAPDEDCSRELAAYRRAEQVERQARARAAQLCDQVNGLMADLTARMTENSSEMDAAAEAMGKALDALQAALDNSQSALQDGAKSLMSMRVDPIED